MKKLIVVAIMAAMLVPGAAFAGASTDAALGLGAFAVFNQIISGTGIFGALYPAPRPVVIQPPLQERAIVLEHYPVYVQPPTYYAPAHYPPVHYAPARAIVIQARGWSPRAHAKKGHDGHRW